MTIKEDKTIVLKTLEEFRNKGAAWQSQSKANSLLLKLRSLLPDSDWWELNISHSHYLIGEGAEEFYDTCKRIKVKIKSNGK